MLSPENWQEYEYKIQTPDLTFGTGIYSPDWRIWRVTLVPKLAGATFIIQSLDGTISYSATYGADVLGSTFTLIPAGMFALRVNWTSGADWSLIQIETIRRALRR